jgi:D-serine deaminase-like pyridoxal phosphate-dependent protein
VLTRVLGHYPARRQLLVDCGFTALTKQGRGAQATHAAMIAPVSDSPGLMLSNMTQEIGFVEPVASDASPDYAAHPVGSLLRLVPYHACATAACHPVYYVHDAQGVVREEWRPCRGW